MFALQLSGRPSDNAVQIAINLVLDRAAAVRLGEGVRSFCEFTE
jgi:hypothetical protein